ncbi:fasciclin-like arabinogalactan protein 11 [Pyrus ussuriensis x Pyrus communis]|uniref:Fasciclin-like arabinogalactan protein 11 n=1 Tax=Pyrus ussuriensis x Pyrus communis TaxID=2448454 RepID=A0A5N5HVG9_9ROSA|nr:fasciclin-like arabinogalactan protein 11 [Pyrus ussuriensis x Pyrus communis]
MALSSHLKTTSFHLILRSHLITPSKYIPSSLPNSYTKTKSQRIKKNHQGKKKRGRKKMAPQSFFILLVLFLHSFSSTISAQSPAAAPAPSATNVTAVLEKAGQFTTLIKLLKSTKMADQINTQLSTSNQGMTIFAPTDNAFSSLKAGTLNSISEQQKLQLVQFHILPSFYSAAQFQTVSNPLHTQAGNSPLNVTTSGNLVNITTGVVNATVANTIFTDSQLAVYEVDQVLLPLSIFGPAAPAPAPSKSATKVKGADSPSGSSDRGSTADSSTAMGLEQHGIAEAASVGIIAILAALSL